MDYLGNIRDLEYPDRLFCDVAVDILFDENINGIAKAALLKRTGLHKAVRRGKDHFPTPRTFLQELIEIGECS